MAHSAREASDDVTHEVAQEELDPLLGVTLDGRFRIASLLGKGAMGRVYRAVQVPLNRAVALKVLDSNYGAGREEAFRQRFLVEAALTARLSHPNTVRIFDYGCTKDGIFYLAMEYLDGSTLDRVLAKGPLPWRKALSISQQIARALREAHELGVVHRDLKPANIMLLSADDDTEFAKVLDFGLVKSFIEGHELEGRAITQQGMLLGSPMYMSPEQGERNRADPRCDIYAIGVMLFEMVTGQVPFTGRGEMEIILKHVHDPVPPVVTPPGYDAVPPALQDTIKRCLAKSPMDRFQTMDELLQAFQEIARPIATPAIDLPAPEISQPLSAPAVKPWLLFSGFALAMLVGVGLTALALRRPTRTTDPRPPVRGASASSRAFRGRLPRRDRTLRRHGAAPGQGGGRHPDGSASRRRTRRHHHRRAHPAQGGLPVALRQRRRQRAPHPADPEAAGPGPGAPAARRAPAQAAAPQGARPRRAHPARLPPGRRRGRAGRAAGRAQAPRPPLKGPATAAAPGAPAAAGGCRGG